MRETDIQRFFEGFRARYHHHMHGELPPDTKDNDEERDVHCTIDHNPISVYNIQHAKSRLQSKFLRVVILPFE